jgi:hypothetical protein
LYADALRRRSGAGRREESDVNDAIAARLGDVIRLAERLKAAVEGETPSALLPTFQLMRAGVEVDAMVNILQGHVERLVPASEVRP